MYNFIEYNHDYSKTSGNLQNYYRDEPNSGAGENNVHHTIEESKFFDYKTSIPEILENNDVAKDVEIPVQLKYPGNF